MKTKKIIPIIIVLIIILNTLIPTITLAISDIEEKKENSVIIRDNVNGIEGDTTINEDGKDEEKDSEESTKNETTDSSKENDVEKDYNSNMNEEIKEEDNLNEKTTINNEAIDKQDITKKDTEEVKDTEELISEESENAGTDLSVFYRTHVEDEGWQNYVQNGEMSGTSGKSLRLEAMNIKLLNNENENLHIKYQVHVEDIGWQEWKTDGEIAGTEGKKLRLEAIQIKIVKKPKIEVNYTYNQEKNIVIVAIKSDKELSNINDNLWKLSEDKLTYTKEYNENDIYKVIVKDIDGIKRRLELQVKQISEPINIVKYNSHIENNGWEKNYSRRDGDVSGTTEQEKRLEAIRISLGNSEYIPKGASIKYQVHVQDYGWMNWKRDGEIVGTQGESKRIEAIKIKIEGMEDYSVIYRTHVQNIGWTQWANNGEVSGTEGQSKRIEAIQIKIIEGKYEKFKLSFTNGENIINEYKKNNKHYIFVPKGMDISNLVINYEGNVLSSSFGTLNKEDKTIKGDFINTENFTLSLVSGDTENVSVIQSDVPSIFINLDNNVTQNTLNSGSKDVKYKASLNITGAETEKYNISDNNIEIKGRGNTTWIMPKKPYQIKLNKKQNLFGIGKDKAKKWVLLANYYDSTLLKNKIMDDLCVNSGLSNIPNSKAVDLYINGDYVGNYLLCDKVEVGDGRVELNDDKGVLVELDNAYYNDEEYNFQSQYSGNHYTIKEFKNDDIDANKKNQVMNSFKNSLEEFERKLYIDHANWNDISRLIDVDSFAKFYVLNEFSKNLDTYFSSTYLYKDGDSDVIHMGPLWDYDKDSFAGATHIDYSTNLSNFMNGLYKYPEFHKIVNELYEKELKNIFDTIDVKEYANNIKQSSRINSIVWNLESKYKESIVRLDNWIQERKKYFDLRYISKTPNVYYSMHIESNGWQNATCNNNVAGTIGLGLRSEAIRICAVDENNDIIPIEYQTHIENIGWQNPVKNGKISGTCGQALRMEAIKIKLKNPNQYSIKYRVHVQDEGWMPWCYDGEIAGTIGQSKRLEAIQIELIKK